MRVVLQKAEIAFTRSKSEGRSSRIRLLRLRRILHARRTINIAMNPLHLRLNGLQILRTLKQRLGMLRQLCVWQIRLITQRVLQARPIIHCNCAELHLHRRVMRARRQKHWHSVNHVQTAVPIRLWVFNVILNLQHLNIRLLGKVLRNRVHVVAIVANHADSSHVEEVVANRTR